MTQVRNFTQIRRVRIQRQLIKSDELGQVAVNLLRKYLDQIYNPVSAQPSGVNSASVSDAGFFQTTLLLFSRGLQSRQTS